jgi:hypothetical protein
LLLKDYRLHGVLETPWIEGRFTQTLYSPSLMETLHLGNSLAWANGQFEKTFATELGGTLKLAKGKWQPHLTLGNASKLIYFGENALPLQQNGSVSYWRAGMLGKWQLGKWYAEAEGIYAQSTNEQALPMPRWFANATVYYQAQWVKGRFPIQIGLDMHWHSAYHANFYMPVTQQFYRQTQFKVGNYPFAEIFVNAQVRTVRLFAKFTNALQGLPKQGYYLTPGHMAQPRQFEFGLNWKFYD